MAAIERGLALFLPSMAAAAFAALKLLTQFGDLKKRRAGAEAVILARVKPK